MPSRYITKNDRTNLLNQMVLIDEKVLSSSATSIDFSDIPDTYKDLIIVFNLRSDRANATDPIHVNLGGTSSIDTGANYDYYMNLTGTNTTNSTDGAATYFRLTTLGTGGTATAGLMSSGEFIVHDYSKIGAHRIINGATYSPADGTVYNASHAYGRWKNTTDKVSRLRLSFNTGPNVVAGSHVQVYGRGIRDGATVQEINNDLPRFINTDGLSGNKVYTGSVEPTVLEYDLRPGDIWIEVY